MARRRAPFLAGYSTGIPQADKDQVIKIMGDAAETIRRYAERRYPWGTKGSASLCIMAGMLEWEAKQWAARVVTSEDDHPRGGFRIVKGGKA